VFKKINTHFENFDLKKFRAKNRGAVIGYAILALVGYKLTRLVV
jgi:hypothetical protein